MNVKNNVKGGKYSFEYAVGLNQWSMRLLGLWPLDVRYSTLKWSIALMVALSFLLPSMARMIMLDDWRLVIEQAVSTAPLCLLLMKLSYIRAKAANLRIILEAMMDDWSKFNYLPNWAKKSMARYAKIGRRVNLTCISCMLVSIFGYTTLPSRRHKDNLPRNATLRALPTEGIYPFDDKKSPIYEMIYASQATVSLLYCITTFSLDCFLCIIVFHACGQLSTLSKTLKMYGKYTEHVQKQVICACLKCIVKRHIFITKYMELVEKSFNEFVLLQILGNCFILAAEGYQLAAYAEDSDAWGFLTFAFYTTTVTFNIFIYCYIGESIIQKSIKVSDTAYNLEWDDLPRRLAEPLILVMIRSKKVCKITAGGFGTMSLSYYKRIITKTISYISVLRAIK